MSSAADTDTHVQSYRRIMSVLSQSPLHPLLEMSGSQILTGRPCTGQQNIKPSVWFAAPILWKYLNLCCQSLCAAPQMESVKPSYVPLRVHLCVCVLQSFGWLPRIPEDVRRTPCRQNLSKANFVHVTTFRCPELKLMSCHTRPVNSTSKDRILFLWRSILALTSFYHCDAIFLLWHPSFTDTTFFYCDNLLLLWCSCCISTIFLFCVKYLWTCHSSSIVTPFFSGNSLTKRSEVICCHYNEQAYIISVS